MKKNKNIINAIQVEKPEKTSNNSLENWYKIKNKSLKTLYDIMKAMTNNKKKIMFWLRIHSHNYLINNYNII